VNQLAQKALIARLASTLRGQGSWTGETHLQKATYLLRDLADVPFDFDFILYKHGPFSFELRDELGDMQADDYLVREPQEPPYGPRFDVTPRGKKLEARFRGAMTRYGSRVDWISEQLCGKGVAALERLATGLWVTRHAEEGASVESRAAALQEIKRHVAQDDAVSAIEKIDKMLVDSAEAQA
jgi:hypothetical protein